MSSHNHIDIGTHAKNLTRTHACTHGPVVCCSCGVRTPGSSATSLQPVLLAQGPPGTPGQPRTRMQLIAGMGLDVAISQGLHYSPSAFMTAAAAEDAAAAGGGKLGQAAHWHGGEVSASASASVQLAAAGGGQLAAAYGREMAVAASAQLAGATRGYGHDVLAAARAAGAAGGSGYDLRGGGAGGSGHDLGGGAAGGSGYGLRGGGAGGSGYDLRGNSSGGSGYNLRGDMAASGQATGAGQAYEHMLSTDLAGLMTLMPTDRDVA